MEKRIIDESMITILKDIINTNFHSFECCFSDENLAVGNLRINTSIGPLEIKNCTTTIRYFDSVEDVNCFTCNKCETNKKFVSYIKGKTTTVSVNESIIQINIITDTITVNDPFYQIQIDQAIEIITQNSKYVFCKDWQFSENIIIKKDGDFCEIYPIEKVKEHWSNAEENCSDVEVVRTIKKI